MNYGPAAFSLGLLGSLLLVSPAHAQMRGGNGFAPAGRPGAMNRGRPAARYVRPHYAHRRYAGYGPYFYPYYPYDYDDGSVEVDPPSPPRFQTETSTSSAPTAAVKPAESMVVELRGDRWIRLTSSGPQEVSIPSPQPSGTSTASNAKPLQAFAQSANAATPPPATLIFRDGHQEQTAKYTIVGSTIYLKSDYYTSGSWLRKIPISDLDVPATLRLNRERGTNFALPSRPSEVILRP
jgi:hypothetical protein